MPDLAKSFPKVDNTGTLMPASPAYNPNCLLVGNLDGTGRVNKERRSSPSFCVRAAAAFLPVESISLTIPCPA